MSTCESFTPYLTPCIWKKNECKKNSFSYQKKACMYDHTYILSDIWWRNNKKNNISYNSKRRIAWFPQRWRTQRDAIRNVNCRTCESSKFWTQMAPWDHGISVWVSIINLWKDQKRNNVPFFAPFQFDDNVFSMNDIFI